MSHGIKLFPTTPNHKFVSTNYGWTAESGASINANATTIAAQNQLRIISSGQTIGAISPLLTLVGSETPVRAEVLYKTVSTSQSANVSVLDQAGTVIASTVFVTSAYSTTYNDYRRAVLDVTVPTGVTGVRCRICRGNATAGEITVESVAFNENILLLDPDDISRSPAVVRSEQLTLSGRRVVDVLHRHYQFSYGWNAIEAASYDRLQSYFYRNEALWLDDGDVPANQEVHGIYCKGKIDLTNARSQVASGAMWVQTVVDSLLPNDSGFPSAVTSWADGAITNLGSTNGASFTTTLNSAYTYARFNLPTVGGSIGSYRHSATLSVDVLTEIKSTASGPYGFDVWVKDAVQGIYRKVRSIIRTGVTNVVLDMRSTDMLTQFKNANYAARPVEILFRARSTNRVPGATLTFKNFKWLGNHGFDVANTNGVTMGGFGVHTVDFVDKPKAISYVQLDSTAAASVRDVTSLTAQADYVMAENGVAFALPSPNANSGQYDGASALIRYTRDFQVVIDTLPERFLRTGALTSHDRVLQMSMHTIRSSKEDQL